jgi:hypothetical protein
VHYRIYGQRVQGLRIKKKRTQELDLIAIESVSQKLRTLLGLKAKDFNLTIENGAATFECPYFLYSYMVELNQHDLSKAIFTAELIPVGWINSIRALNNA